MRSWMTKLTAMVLDRPTRRRLEPRMWEAPEVGAAIVLREGDPGSGGPARSASSASTTVPIVVRSVAMDPNRPGRTLVRCTTPVRVGPVQPGQRWQKAQAQERRSRQRSDVDPSQAEPGTSAQIVDAGPGG